MNRQNRLPIAVFLLALLVIAPSSAFSQKDKKDPNRIITGTVMDDKENPISGAVVYLKNTRTLAVKSYISDDKGSFRFTNLSPNSDFEIYAESKGKRSATKTFSVFDSRKQVDFTLKIS